MIDYRDFYSKGEALAWVNTYDRRSRVINIETLKTSYDSGEVIRIWYKD